jgi:hypothetical protein
MNPLLLANFYKFFKEKNALSPETAVSPTKEEFLELGLPGGFGWYFGIPLMSPINKTSDNKYWFSVKYYENNTRNVVLVSLLVILISIIVMAVIFGLYFQSAGLLKYFF